MEDISAESNATVAYFKNNTLSVANETGDITQVDVFNTIGQTVTSHRNIQNNKEVLLNSPSFASKQIFVVIVTDKSGHKKSLKVMNILN